MRSLDFRAFRLLLVAFLWLCAVSLQAQNMSYNDVVKAYKEALSYMKSDNKKYAEARAIFNRILPYADDEIRYRISRRMPMAWYFEGSELMIAQKYADATNSFENARRGFHEAGMAQDETSALLQLAKLNGYAYDPMGALALYKEAETQARTAYSDKQLMTIAQESETVARQIGNEELACRMMYVQDSLMEKASDPKVIFNYNKRKGDVTMSQGSYQLAEQWYERNREYVESLDDDYVGPERYLFYHSLRSVYTKMKRFDEALAYAMKCLQVWQATFDANDSQYYYPYREIANSYMLKGDSVRCFNSLDTLFKSAAMISEPKELYYLYTQRASCNATFNNYEAALADYKKADSLLAAKYDDDDGDRVALLSLMGGMENKLSHYAESERLYALYAERIMKLYGEDSDEYVDAISFLANAEAFAGHIDEGCSHYSEAVDMLKIRVRKRLPYLTAAERNGYWQSVSSMLTNMSPFAIKVERTQMGFTRTCYDALIMSKAFLLESDRSTYDIIKKHGSAKDMDNFSTIQSLSLKMKAWEKDYQHNADSITATSARIEQVSRNLASRCRAYDDMTAFMDVDYNDVKSALGNNDMLIDFTDYVSESEGRKYAAFIIDKQQDYPLLKYLFAERSIDSLQMARADYFYEEPYASEVRKLVWKPFEAFVHEGMTIYYVPSQLLFNVSLESIPMEDGTQLGEHYRFVRLSSARELLSYSSQLDIAKSSKAVLYGGLQYDVEPTLMAAEAKKYEVSPLFAMRGGDITRGDTIFLTLPETLKEVETIGKILRSKGVDVKTFTGKSGTEESFLSMNGNAPQILQVATHGFYYQPNEAQRINYLQGFNDAMQLSGLVMSGGNAAWRGKNLPKGVLGGVLTANDIASLDLEGMEMVVLSACQTGQGKATVEGLYGLQRAFKKTGAKTLVMTLWNISDAVCREFMVNFYEQLATNGWDKRKAFDNAKSTIRQKYPEAFYWAGFVMLD